MMMFYFESEGSFGANILHTLPQCHTDTSSIHQVPYLKTTNYYILSTEISFAKAIYSFSNSVLPFETANVPILSSAALKIMPKNI